MAKVLKIKAKTDGYRRAGIEFKASETTIIPLTDLKKEQIEALNKDKNLLVVEGDDKDKDSNPAA